MANIESIENKVAIVTGGATMIGAAVVSAFIEAGANAVSIDINQEDGEKVVSAFGDRAVFMHGDVTKDADLKQCVATAVEKFGGVDFVVNIASTYLDNGIESSREEWLEAFNVNVVGGAMLVQAAIPEMKKRGGGAIVNYSSISAKVAQPGRMLYPACKAAIANLTKTQAHQLAEDNIRVNTVSPGWTWSNIMDQLTEGDRAKADRVAAPFHLAGRTGDPGEVADVVVFLCSDKASFVNAADIPVDGGYSAIGAEQKVDTLPLLME